MLSLRQRAAVLLVPWAFVALYAAIYVLVLLPRALGGSAFGDVIGVIVAAIWIVFAVAAVTFSRDVLRGQWPLES